MKLCLMFLLAFLIIGNSSFASKPIKYITYELLAGDPQIPPLEVKIAGQTPHWHIKNNSLRAKMTVSGSDIEKGIEIDNGGLKLTLNEFREFSLIMANGIRDLFLDYIYPDPFIFGEVTYKIKGAGNFHQDNDLLYFTDRYYNKQKNYFVPMKTVGTLLLKGHFRTNLGSQGLYYHGDGKSIRVGININ